MERRIKFHGLSDLATPSYIEKSELFLSDLDFDSIPNDINTIIEIYNILKYIDAGVEFNNYPNIKKELNKVIGKYIGNIKNKSLMELYTEIDRHLYLEFWELFSKYKLCNVYDNEEFSKLINDCNPEIRYILQVNNLVKHYDEQIKQYLISDIDNVSILLEQLEIEGDGFKKDVYIPKSLTYEEIDDLLQKYIDSDRPSLNLLSIITTIRDRDEIKISDKTRLKAKRMHEKETDKFFQENEGKKFGVSIMFKPDMKDAGIVYSEGGITHLEYSFDWIKNNLDESTILNNFIFLFEYVDKQMRVAITSLKNEMSQIEFLFSTSSKNNYPTGWSFNYKEQVSNIQIHAYRETLKSLNVNLEDIYKWFFSTYMKENFHIENFDINIPSSDITYFEKCRILIPEVESILKKYNMYAHDGLIDLELLTMSSKPLPFSDCKSLFPIKNIYPNYTDYTLLCYYFFSDQCMLSYIENDEHSYSTFYDLLINKRVLLSDIQEYLHKDLEWLQEKKWIKIVDNNEITFYNSIEAHILYNLYKFETINYLNVPRRYQKKIDELLSIGELTSTGTLLSLPEVKYFNYYLNKKDFGNSLDLRNKYVHGTQPHDEGNSSIHQFNYLLILKVIVLIIIKINDELCEKDNLTIE